MLISRQERVPIVPGREEVASVTPVIEINPVSIVLIKLLGYNLPECLLIAERIAV